MQRWLIAPAALLALAACSGKEKSSDSAKADRATAAKADSTAAATPGADVPNDPSAATVMRVRLTGGSVPGTYTAKSKDRTCSVGGTQGDDVWANSFIDTNASSDSALGVLNVTTAPLKRVTGAGTTDQVNLALSIGNPMGKSKDFSLDSKAAKKSGSATATLKDDGRTATLTIKGTTAAGVGVDAVLICNQVRRGR